MNTFKCWTVILSLVVALVNYAQAACDQTLSVGANISSAVSSAPVGSTICLNAGNYGVVNLFDVSRSGFVTLQSISGVTAKMSPQIGNSKYIKFVNMTLSDVLVSSCSTHIHFVGTTFVSIGQVLYEGRLNFVSVNGAVVKNSVFSGISTSSSADGIQMLGDATHCEAVQDFGGEGTADSDPLASEEKVVNPPANLRIKSKLIK